MRFLLMFVLGIGVSLCLRQQSLPSIDSSALVSSFWLGHTADFLLLVPFAISLLCIAFGFAQTDHEKRQKKPQFKLCYAAWFACAAFSLGFGIAALDTRAVDLPWYWAQPSTSATTNPKNVVGSPAVSNALAGHRWVYGKIDGLPKSTVKQDLHTARQVITHRFTFQALCWQVILEGEAPVGIPAQDLLGPAKPGYKSDFDRGVNQKEPETPIEKTHFKETSLQYIGLRGDGALDANIDADVNRAESPWGRGGCKKPSQSVPSFWQQLQVSMTSEVDLTEQTAAGNGVVVSITSDFVRPGQWVWLLLKLHLVRGQVNPGADDFARWAFVNRQSVRGRVLRNVPRYWLHHRWHLDAWRDRASERLRAVVSRYPGAQRLLPAIMLGDRRWLEAADWRALNRVGLGHLVAISGLHIGFAAGIGYFIGLRILRALVSIRPTLSNLCPLQMGAWCFAWIAGFAYSALSGFALPTVRALLALTLLCVWRWRFSHLTLAQVWMMSATILLSYSPRWLFDVSFLLSFGAVGVLIWCMSRQVFRESRFKQSWRLQWGLSFGISPLNVAFFHQVTWFSPFINFLVIPLFSFVLVPLLAVSSVSGIVWPELAHWLLNLCAMWVDSALAGVSGLADIPQISTGWMLRSSLAGIAMLGAFALWLCPQAWRARGLGTILLVVALCHQPHEPIHHGGFRMTVLDVGQGLAIALETQSHMMVYDPGPAYGSQHQVDRAWLPFLRYYDQATIDLMVVSHGDADHAGSARPFLKAIDTKRYMALMPMPSLAGVAPDFEVCQAGAEWVWDGVHFEVLFPDGDNLATRNISCVIKVTGEQHSILLTGDIDRQMEAKLLKRYAPHVDQINHPLQSDILLVPHHGSKTSSSTGLINHVAPNMAIVSHGYHNRFGHPHTVVQSRYEVRDIRWLSTALAGAVTVTSSTQREGLSVEVASARDKFWRF